MFLVLLGLSCLANGQAPTIESDGTKIVVKVSQPRQPSSIRSKLCTIYDATRPQKKKKSLSFFFSLRLPRDSNTQWTALHVLAEDVVCRQCLHTVSKILLFLLFPIVSFTSSCPLPFFTLPSSRLKTLSSSFPMEQRSRRVL